MLIAVTGATGFLGRHLVADFLAQGHSCRCWYRPGSDRSGFPAGPIEWVPGSLRDPSSNAPLVAGCDAVVHAALDRPGDRFIGGEGDDLPRFVDTNLVGTLRLIEAARAAGVGRFVFISTCAVYDQILADRPLDEAHPLWPASHYGAHKAAIEAFVHSHGLGQGYPICALRPTGIYGLARPASRSKWHDLIHAVASGRPVECRKGGKEVHAADVARASSLLLKADPSALAGQSFNCYDMYISEHDVAHLARQLTGSPSEILGDPPRPKHQIDTRKLAGLGMTFGGRPLLEQTIRQILAS
jgi:nucleoside-diphosphate-sugar epimerase